MPGKLVPRVRQGLREGGEEGASVIQLDEPLMTFIRNTADR